MNIHGPLIKRDIMEVLDRINELKEEINKANEAYYVNDKPYMEDYEYDRLMA